MEGNKQHDLSPYSTWASSAFLFVTVQSCPLALPQCHPQLRSLIALLLLWATPQIPALLLQLRISAQAQCPTKQISPLSVTLTFLASHFLILFLKLISIPAPRSMYQEQHLPNSAPPQMSLPSRCCQPSSLICMVTFSSLTLSSAAPGLHTSRGQEPSNLPNLWEGLGLPNSESKCLCRGLRAAARAV